MLAPHTPLDRGGIRDSRASHSEQRELRNPPGRSLKNTTSLPAGHHNCDPGPGSGRTRSDQVLFFILLEIQLLELYGSNNCTNSSARFFLILLLVYARSLSQRSLWRAKRAIRISVQSVFPYYIIGVSGFPGRS